MWDWAFTFEILPVLARAAIISIEATLLGFVLAAVLGLILAILATGVITSLIVGEKKKDA